MNPRQGTSLAVAFLLACGLASCSSTFHLQFRGEEDMNLNSRGKPNAVWVRILRLEGDASVAAFQGAEWDLLWDSPDKVPNLKRHGEVQEACIEANSDLVRVKVPNVQSEVTHFGVLAQFSGITETGGERAVLARGETGAQELWLHAERGDDNQIRVDKSGKGYSRIEKRKVGEGPKPKSQTAGGQGS